jgi:hypothetical protein
MAGAAFVIGAVRVAGTAEGQSHHHAANANRTDKPKQIKKNREELLGAGDMVRFRPATLHQATGLCNSN